MYLKNLVPLGDVINKITVADVHHSDRSVEPMYVEYPDLDRINIDGREHPMSLNAQRQLCSKIGVPHNFMKKMDEYNRINVLDEFMTKHQDKSTDESKLFVRFNDDKVRALFTQRYRPLDNIDIAKQLLAQHFDMDMKVQANIGENILTINIPSVADAFDIQGDTMYPGITIVNSETGWKSFWMAAFIYRLVCSNGLISMQTVAHSRFKHISDKLVDRIPGMLNSAKQLQSENKFLLRDQLTAARAIPVNEPDKVFAKFNKEYSVSLPQQSALKWAWPQEQGDSMFNIIQTYTHAAQMPKLDPEDSFELQLTGGKVLSTVRAAA